MTKLLDWRPLPGRPRTDDTRRKEKENDRPDPLPAHVGAWLNHYLANTGRRETQDTSDSTGDGSGKDKPARMALLQSAIEALGPDTSATNTWRTGYARWMRNFCGKRSGVRSQDVVVVTKSRMLLHIASGSSVTDGSILLHHTWGVPYLPGSALKGIARTALTEKSLRRRGELSRETLGALLGEGPSDQRDERAAFIDFLDAPWVPTEKIGCNPTDSPLALDVVTPHHGDYYTKSNDRPFPTDFDDPVPTHRLSIAPCTKFHIVIEAHPSIPQEWLVFVVDQVLIPALREDGMGAWTSSGYGRLDSCRR